ncbi:hypothetical protein PHYPSEUDO_013449 [Phytophthora pseudosyringae]|uniref:PX domain-containing protein n=1 Tax=Phytophthora pseudosyringae TaxID=221518 RepID=A0A8T1WIG0_9STRA|nr:hypothetical protein PHYPSEUDO_013449 [Phytophthora pseudosyringae]
MREIDARVTGFDYSSFHAYTTEVEVDGRAWTLAIRYNAFYRFYTRLAALEKHFAVDFPPKGGLFFSPPPEERQEQLDDFLLSTLAYFDMRGRPRRMEALLGELLQIPEHLDSKDDDGERTASEGSSVAEELLLLDTPLPGHEDGHDDFLVSDQEVDDQDAQRDNATPPQLVEGNQVEAVVEVAQEPTEELKAQRVQEEDNQAAPEEEAVELETKSRAVEGELEEKPSVVEVDILLPTSEIDNANPIMRQQSEELTGGGVAKDYIAMLRRKTLVDGAIQAAVVSTMKGNVEKSKAAEERKPVKEEEETKPSESVEVETEEVNTTELGKEKTMAAHEQGAPAPEVEEQPAVPIVEEEPAVSKEPAVLSEAIPVETATETGPGEAPVSVLELSENASPAPEEEVVDALESEVVAGAIEADLDVAEIEQDTGDIEEMEDVQDDESSVEEESVEEPESENPVVSWFRRMGTFGPSAAEKEEQETAAKKETEEQEAAGAAAAAKLEQEEKEATDRAAKTQEAAVAAQAEADNKEAAEAELLRAEQELNLRLKAYRHPVFFQGFNCDVGTSRYSLPQCLSDGVIV